MQGFAIRDGGPPQPDLTGCYDFTARKHDGVWRLSRWNVTADQSDIARLNHFPFEPFSSGQHFCMGTNMACMTARFFLTSLFQRYQPAVPRDWRPEPRFTFSVTVKTGRPVTLAKL